MHDNHELHKPTSLRTQLSIFFGILLLSNGLVAAISSTYGRTLERAGVWPWQIGLGQIVGGVLIIINLLIIVWYLDKKFHPLEELTAFASRLERGDFYSRLYIPDNSELGHLAYHLNTMADQLTSQIESLKKSHELKQEFIAISSHNLQTPLIVIRGYLEQLEKETHTLSAQQKRAITGITNQTARLSYIVNRLIKINQLQGELITLHRHPTDLTTLTQEVVDAFQSYARSKQVSLVYNHPNNPLMVEVDKEWIRYVWENLLDNAIKYTQNNGAVTVTIGTNENAKVYGEVEDTGIGIPLEEQESVFTPFHRAQDVLDASYGGFGLGLYGSRLVIERHRGNIYLGSEVGKGTIVRFTLDQ